MANTLQGAIDELIAVVAAVDGINYAPDDPTQQVTLYPAAVVYASDGLVSDTRASTTNQSLHSPVIAVLMPLVDLVQANIIMLPLYEPITNALITHLNGRTSTNYATFRNISYTYGPIEWPSGQDMFGFLFTINDMKIIGALS